MELEFINNSRESDTKKSEDIHYLKYENNPDFSLLPLRNRNKEVIDYTIIDSKFYEELKDYRFYKTNRGYVYSDKLRKSLHSYIFYDLLKNEFDENKQSIDHIDRNKRNNTCDNLRYASHSENMRNKRKRPGTYSKYYGVSFILKNNGDKNWVAKIRIPDDKLGLTNNKKRLMAYYDTELKAAYQRDLWIKRYDLQKETMNNLNEPENFVEWKSSKKERTLPKNITMTKHKTFVVNLNDKYIGTFKTLEEAEQKLDQTKEIENEIKSEILRDEKGCFFLIKEDKIYIDEEDYHKVTKYNWWISKQSSGHKKVYGSVYGELNFKKSVLLSHYILDYKGKNTINYIDRDFFNNQKHNLIEVKLNERYIKSKTKNKTTSIYKGVAWKKSCGKWVSYITKDRKQIHLGLYVDEIEAAKVYDEAAKKYFGELAILNFPEKNKKRKLDEVE